MNVDNVVTERDLEKERGHCVNITEQTMKKIRLHSQKMQKEKENRI